MRSIALLHLTSPSVLPGLRLSNYKRLCAAKHWLAAKTVPCCTAPVEGQLKQQASALARRADLQLHPSWHH